MVQGLCHFLGYLLHDRVRIYAYGFFVEIHSLVSFFGISGFMGMILREFSGFMGVLFRIFSTFMSGTFTI